MKNKALFKTYSKINCNKKSKKLFIYKDLLIRNKTMKSNSFKKKKNKTQNKEL